MHVAGQPERGMIMSYTKGPWRVVEADTPGVLYISGPAQTLTIITTALDLDFADYVKRTADAQLIAAAPELFETLQEVVAFWDSITMEDYVNDIHVRARAAIAKAKGEQA